MQSDSLRLCPTRTGSRSALFTSFTRVSNRFAKTQTANQVSHEWPGLLASLGGSLFDRRRESSWHINGCQWSGAGAAAAITALVPDFDLVVVVTAGLYASPLPYWVPTQWLNRHVLEAVRECSCILVPKVAILSKLSSSFGVPGHWRAAAPFANYR